MVRLIAGADVSGNIRGGGQKRHIAFVLGTEERINKIYRDIGLKKIHMTKLTDAQHEKVYQKLDFRRSDIIVWCFEAEKRNIVNYIFKHSRLSPKTRSKQSVENNFDHHFLQEFRDTLENFTISNGVGLKELVVECEIDMRFTVKYWGMNEKTIGKAYELADAVAWFNEKNRKIKHCNHIDIRNIVKEKMESELLK